MSSPSFFSLTVEQVERDLVYMKAFFTKHDGAGHTAILIPSFCGLRWEHLGPRRPLKHAHTEKEMLAFLESCY